MYRGVGRIFARYWRTYGGVRALLRSPYLHVSLVLTILMWPLWWSTDWWQLPISVMPSVLGFSLGGYAIWLAIGDRRFRDLIVGEDNDGDASPFMSVNAAFVHFILLQFASILTALLFGAWAPEQLADLSRRYFFAVVTAASLGFFLFVYALLAAVAALMTIFRVATWYEQHITTSCKERPPDD